MSKKIILPDVADYYEKTRWDYRWVWGTRNTQALHYGYYEKGVTNHAAAVANKNRVLADMVNIQSTDKVLDAGCGVGGSAIWLAKNRGCKVVGISLSKGQVKDATDFAEQRNVAQKATFQKADFTQTPFESASFDVVWAIESVCHAEEKSTFFKEAYRLLRPGGRLVINDFFRTDRPFSNAQEELLQSWLHGWAMPDIDTPGEHSAHAKQAGFKNVEYTDITPHVKQSILNLHEHGRKWSKPAKWLNKIGIVSDMQVGNVRGTVDQYRAFEQGLWGQGVLTALK